MNRIVASEAAARVLRGAQTTSTSATTTTTVALGYAAPPPPVGVVAHARWATKKAASYTSNGRDSRPKFRGVKLSDGQFASVGALLFKQEGTRILPGFGVVAGKGGNLHAELPGIVKYYTNPDTRRKYASILIDDDIRRAITKTKPSDPRPLFDATGVVGWKCPREGVRGVMVTPSPPLGGVGGSGRG